MKEALDLRSKSGIHRLITALEERGFIRRLPHRARALEILKLPDAMQPEAMRKHSGTVIEAAFPAPPRPPAQLSEPQGFDAARGVSVPLMGRIAAGVPISAIQNHSQDVVCPPDLLGKGEHFALEVRGDSMIDAGIHENDIVIIRRGSSADNGDIVVALVEKEEATLKRLRKGPGSSVALEAANPKYETRVLSADQVDVQGRLVGLIRRY
jgi:repressor LexA